MTKLDEASADTHLSVGLGGAVDDQLGVHIEPETALLFRATVRARDATQRSQCTQGRLREAELSRRRRGDLAAELASDQFRDFHRAEPDPPDTVHRQDPGHGLLLGWCPGFPGKLIEIGQAGVSRGFELKHGFRERHVLGDGGFDHRDEFFERNVGGNRGELDGSIVRYGIRRGKRWRGKRHLDPTPVGIAVVTQGGNVTRSPHPHMHKPVPGFRMNVHLGMRGVRNPIAVYPQNHMPVQRELVVFAELDIREIPMRVEPVRVTRHEQKSLRSVRGGQFAD
jgi:hypothetical protein